MIEFDGVDDEIMIPHLPTIIPNAYTIEAWVRPATVKAMNIIVRTNETYPQSAWSHQLRINAEGAPLHVAPLSAPLLLILGRLDGQFEHYVETDEDEPEKIVVSHTARVTPGQWYHVAGVASNAGTVRLYVNGKEEGQAVQILTGGLRPGLDRYFIGSASGDGMAHFEGNVAEVRVWNFAMSCDEIHDNYRKVLMGTERGRAILDGHGSPHLAQVAKRGGVSVTEAKLSFRADVKLSVVLPKHSAYIALMSG
eukprot:scaffold100728_cov35-Tisochrysis_lutea.AAC.1